MDNDGKNPKKHKRRTKYDTHIKPNFDVILGLLRSRKTEESIATSVGVGYSTWKRYKVEHKEFIKLVVLGQKRIGALCVNSLYKLAQGYDYEEIHTKITETSTGGKGSKSGRKVTTQVINKITKHVPGSVAANIMIICNRDPDNWQNTQNVKHDGQLKLTMPVVTFEFTGEGKDDEG